MTTRYATVFAGLLLISCSKSPSAPSTPGSVSAFANYEGLWEGVLRHTYCDGRRSCDWFPYSARFVLNLRQNGPSVSGILATSSMTAEVRGIVATSGASSELLLTGITPAPSDKADVGTIDVTRLVLRQDVGRLLGSIEYTSTPAPGSLVGRHYGVATLRYAADVLATSRVSPPSQGYTARWIGWSVVRECTTTGRYCDPRPVGESANVDLALQQDGDEITGHFGRGWMPVRGTVSGGTLRLDGFITSHLSETRLSDFTARIDEFGRLRGTFTYAFSYLGSPFGSTSVAKAELWQVLNYRPEM
jgi:hypothetical protein